MNSVLYIQQSLRHAYIETLYKVLMASSITMGSVDSEIKLRIRVWGNDWGKHNACGRQDWPGCKISQKSLRLL